GLPNPLDLVGKVLKHAAPTTFRKLQRKMTMPSATTLEATRSKWLSGFNLDVGRNSHFYTETLTDEQLEFIGGAEYRALRVLSYLVPAYFIGSQLIAFIIFAPWLSTTSTYDDVFNAQPRLVNKTWFAFSLFQIMAAYTGGGLSLVDAGMVPFQTAYLMIFPLMFAILAGNHALVLLPPRSLRLIIWVGSKLSREGGDLDQAFDFLLHHPRRFVNHFRFPSHQTWFLVISLLVMSAIEWVGFEVLNTGLDVYTALNTGAKIVDGFFQGLAARASGFTIVALSETAPALQFLYVVMMYIAVYPVAMSIRSTNVNEEGSLGIFEAPPDDEDEEPADLDKYEPRERVGKYLSWHLRRQVSIDIWWLVWAVFFVAIIERGQLMNPDEKWFDMFRVLFELVSAFGGIGLSLGLPNANYSFCGSFKPLSKLVVIIIMVRGRHRGLPVAIDPAVTLPLDLARRRREEEQRSRNASMNGLGLEVDPEV
ncbi:TrkH-domain-containing protein, partial [Hymenopellis radicata]